MDNEYVVIVDGELYHHGTIGMKWGRRRYQNKDGSLTPAGKKRYASEMDKVKAEKKKIKNQERTEKKIQKLEKAKQEIKDLKASKKAAEKDAKKESSSKSKQEEAKKAKQEKAEESDADKKARLLREPNAKEILANRKLFSDSELNAVQLRMATEQRIAALEPPTVSKGEAFANKFVKNATMTSGVLESGAKAWNSIAKISNSLLGTDLPSISEKTKSKLDKFKEEVEWEKAKAEQMEVKNKKRKAELDDPDREKTAAEKFEEETAEIKRQVERKKAVNNLTDKELDARALVDRERKMNETAAEEAAKKADGKKKADDDARNYNTKKSEEYYNTDVKLPDPKTPDYESASGKKERVGDIPNDRALTIYNPKSSLVSSGKTSTGIISKINTMTSTGNKTYAEIAKELGVSVSTVQNYSKGKSAADRLMSYDEKSNFVGYWSAIKEDDGYVI